MISKKKVTKEQVKLSAPWETIQHMVAALLAPDTEVEVTELSETSKGVYSFDVISKNGKKIAALEKVIKNTFNVGNVTVNVNFIHEREEDEVTAQDFLDAFEGNSNFVTVADASKGLFNISYVIFAKEILQFFNDDLSDINGNMSIIVADAAKNVCNITDGMSFCTDVE